MALWDCRVGREPRRNGAYFAAAPTQGQAKRIWWDDLMALIPPNWLAGPPSLSELRIVTKWGASIQVVGLDKPQRMEGTPWAGGVIDEYANCGRGSTLGLWQKNIRPALSTVGREGWCWLIGVPDADSPGQVEYEKMVDYAASGVDPEWATFTWPSADILDPAEVAAAERTMDPRTFAQEYLGRFVLTGGRAFPDFDHKPGGAHVRPCLYDPALPLCWSLDFNIAKGSPACSGVIQHRAGQVRVIHEFALDQVRTDTVCDAFLEAAEAGRWDLTNLSLYGDASGSNKSSTSGMSDWAILRNRLKNVVGLKVRVPLANPNIADTRNAVNARVKAADGTVSLAVDPSCKRLIDDLRSALWPSDMEPQHAVSWLRYFIHREYPIRVDRPAGQGSVGFAGGF